MNRAFKLFCISTIFFYSCGTKSDQTENKELENNEQSTEAVEEESITDVSSVDNSDELENTSGAGSVQTYKLKWKSVAYDEYGISYGFENQKGEEVYFFHLNIPGFTDKQNDFYTSIEVDDRIFPVLEIKEEVKNKWYEVKVEIQEIENEAEPSETNDTPVIISIKPL